jgi:hypothetical protein
LESGFAEEMVPASTFETVRAEGCVVLLVVAVVRLTLVRRSRLLGRNLITVFSAVNNLSQKKSRRRSPRSPPPGGRYARDIVAARPCERPPTTARIARRAKKRRVLCGLCARRAMQALLSQAARKRVARCCRRRRPTLNHGAAGGREGGADCPSQRPECAKVRKIFRRGAAPATSVRCRRHDTTTGSPSLSTPSPPTVPPTANAIANRRRRHRFVARADMLATPKRIRPHRAAGPERTTRSRQWSSSSSSSA